MVRQLVVAISVGLADSLNPSTGGPALFLATTPHRVRRVTEFTIGVFLVNLVGGLLLTIGPGRLLLGLLPHPHRTVRHLIELAAGVALLIAAVALWRRRRKLASHELPMRSGGSAFIAGASIAAIELPTAVPYLAVIAGIVASGMRVPGEILLLVVFNVAFVLPLLAIALVLLVLGDRATPWLEQAGAWLQRSWPAVLATVLMGAGSILAVLGGTGLLGR